MENREGEIMVLLSSDHIRIQFKKRMEANVQNFMPFYPEMGAELAQPLRYLREDQSWLDDDELVFLQQELEMREAVIRPKHESLKDLMLEEELGKEDESVNTDSKPINLAKLIKKYTQSMNDWTPPSIIVTGNAGSGKTIYSGMVFAELSDLIDPLEKDIILCSSQLKDTGGSGNLWEDIIKGIRYPNLENISMPYDLRQALTDKDDELIILMIDSLDETVDLDKDQVKKYCKLMMDCNIYPFWFCRVRDYFTGGLSSLEWKEGTGSLQRVHVPRLDGPGLKAMDKPTEWINYSFSTIPLLYSFLTNFEMFTKDQRNSRHEDLIQEIKNRYGKLYDDFKGSNFSWKKELDGDKWDKLLEKDRVPVLSDILCDLMIDTIITTVEEKNSRVEEKDSYPSVDSDLKEFLKSTARYMYEKIVPSKYLDESIPSYISEETDPRLLKFLTLIGLIKQYNRGNYRYSHRAFAEYVLWKYTLPEDRNILISQPLFSWRRFLCPCGENTDSDSYWEPSNMDLPDSYGEGTLDAFFRNTAKFLMWVPPLVRVDDVDESKLAQPWKASFKRDLRFTSSAKDAKDTGEPSLSPQQIEAIRKFVDKHSPIQIRGFPGTGKTFSGVEVLISKLAHTDQPSKRALIVTLNPALTKDIREDIVNKHGGSRELHHLSATDLLGTGSHGKVIQPLSIEEIFDLWAPDLEFSKNIITEADLKNRFERSLRECSPKAKTAKNSLFRAAFTDFNYKMFKPDGNLADLEDYQSGKESVLRRAAIDQGLSSMIADDVRDSWHSTIEKFLSKKIPIHKACMILIHRLRILEGTMDREEIGHLEIAEKIDWRSSSLERKKGETKEDFGARLEDEAENRVKKIMRKLQEDIADSKPESPAFYDMVLVDEIQDLPFQAVVLMSYLTKDREYAHDLMYVGDHAQSLNYDKFEWDKFFKAAKNLAAGLVKEIPEDHPKKYSHHLSQLDSLFTEEEDIVNLNQNWRNSSEVLRMFQKATYWSFGENGDFKKVQTKSVEKLDELEAMKTDFTGLAYAIQTETQEEYEKLIVQLFDFASKNSELSIIVCDKAVEGAIMRAQEDGNMLEEFRTEFFDTFTIKGLERPRTVVLGAWMVSEKGDHSLVAQNNNSYLKVKGSSKITITPEETDRINRRMLVALSRAQDKMAVILPPTGVKQDGSVKSSMFAKQEDIFIQLPSPDLDDYLDEELEGIFQQGEEEHFSTGLIGLSEGIEYSKRVRQDPALSDQLNNNKARVQNLYKQEKDDDDDRYLLSALFKKLDGQKVGNSSLYRFLFSRIYDTSASNNDWREYFDAEKDIKDSNFYGLLKGIKEGKLDSIVLEYDNPMSLATLLRYAEVQYEIYHKTSMMDDLQGPPENSASGASRLRQERIKGAEDNIRREIKRQFADLVDGEAKQFRIKAEGMLKMISRHRLEKLTPEGGQRQQIERRKKDVIKFMDLIAEVDKEEEPKRSQLYRSLKDSNRQTKENLRKVAWFILDNFDYIDSSSDDETKFSLFMDKIVNKLVEDQGAIEVALVSYLPKYRGIRGDDVNNSINLFVRYMKLQNGLMVGNRSTKKELIKLVTNHPNKSSFLNGIVDVREWKHQSFSESVAKLDPDLRFSLIGNIADDSKLNDTANGIMNDLLDDLIKQLLPDTISEEKDPSALKEYKWWELDDKGYISGPKSKRKWLLDYSKIPLYKRDGKRSLNHIISKARDIGKKEHTHRSQKLLSKLEFAISLIRSHEELVRTDVDWNNPIPGAIDTSNRSASGAADLIVEEFSNRLDAVLGYGGKLEYSHLSSIFYLWATSMELSRRIAGQDKFPKDLVDFSLSYPHFPKIITDGKLMDKKEFNKSKEIQNHLNYDALQDFLVMNIDDVPSPLWDKRETIRGKQQGRQRKQERTTDHPRKDNQPLFFDGCLKNYWQENDQTFRPLNKTHLESYCIIRSMDSDVGLWPQKKNEIVLGETENELFTNYKKIVHALINQILLAEREGKQYITAAGLYTCLIKPLELDKLVAKELGIEKKITTTQVKGWLEDKEIELAMWPKSSLTKGGMRTQNWGSIRDFGFIRNLLEDMGIRIEGKTAGSNGSIDLWNVDAVKLNRFKENFDMSFGYTVRTRVDNRTQFFIRRGSKIKDGEEVLFHGTEASCERFKVEKEVAAATSLEEE